MPLLDMNLEELKKYKGINPKPSDFDEYWDESIAEMHAIDPCVELVPADFKHRLQNVMIYILQEFMVQEYTRNLLSLKTLRENARPKYLFMDTVEKVMTGVYLWQWQHLASYVHQWIAEVKQDCHKKLEDTLVIHLAVIL